MTQCRHYVGNGRVREDEQVYYISHFLEGKALRYYDNIIAGDPDEWDLEAFFQHLFREIFPLNYMQQVYDNLNELKHTTTMRAYINDLRHYWRLLGEEPSDRESVRRFWRGLRDHIKTDLTRRGLSPVIHKWTEITTAAQQCEESLGELRQWPVPIIKLTTRPTTRAREDSFKREHTRSLSSKFRSVPRTERSGSYQPSYDSARPARNNKHYSKSRPTKEQYKQWKDEGKCLACGSPEHLI